MALFRFIKVDPTVYIMQFKNGQAVREGTGLSFFYFAPTTSLVEVSMASTDVPFIFKEVTADFQDVTVQGQVVFRVQDPKKIAQLMNFSLDPRTGKYASDDPQKLSQRIVNRAQVLVREELQGSQLKQALATSEQIAKKVRHGMVESEILKSLGIEIVDFSILAIKPTPETARALEAAVREQLLKDADEAVYVRRNAAVEQERGIKENELNTQIAIENKQRQIRETQMDAERSVQAKQRLIAEEDIAGKVALELKNKELVALSAENAKTESDAKAYGLTAVMKAFGSADPKVVNALASVGMKPDQLIARAFRDLAESSAKIGELNISPDLLRELTKS